MSHAIGAVRFSDGKIMFYEFNGTADIAEENLYATAKQLSNHWRNHGKRECKCEKSEAVRIMDTYGSGKHWNGAACRKCKVITDGFFPYGITRELWESTGREIEEEEQKLDLKSGQPEWSPFQKES